MDSPSEGLEEESGDRPSAYARQPHAAAVIGAIPLAATLGALHGMWLGRRELRALDNGGPEARRSGRRRVWRSRAAAATAVGAAGTALRGVYSQAALVIGSVGVAEAFGQEGHAQFEAAFKEARPADEMDWSPGGQASARFRIDDYLENVDPTRGEQFRADQVGLYDRCRQELGSAERHATRATGLYVTTLGASYVAGQQAAKARVVARGQRKAAKQARKAGN